MTDTQKCILEKYDPIFWGCGSRSSIHVTGDPAKLFKWFDRRTIQKILEQRVELCLAQSRKDRVTRLRRIALSYWLLARVVQLAQPPAPRQLAFF